MYITFKTLLHLVMSYFRNLLRPSGVRLQAGTMSIKIYRAEDLPQSMYFISFHDPPKFYCLVTINIQWTLVILKASKSYLVEQ